MEPWTRVVGYLFVPVALRLVFTRTARAGGSDRDESHVRPSMSVLPGSGPASGLEPDGDDGDRDDAPADATRCHRCGAENDRDVAYTYCWRCLERIR